MGLDRLGSSVAEVDGRASRSWLESVLFRCRAWHLMKEAPLYALRRAVRSSRQIQAETNSKP
jgi:hypothetical protein